MSAPALRLEREPVVRHLRVVILLIVVLSAMEFRGLVTAIAEQMGGGHSTHFRADWARTDQTLIFRDTWAASTGFISVPHASSLGRAPLWLERVRRETATTSNQKLALAILGLPVDTGHEEISGSPAERLCLAAEGKQVSSLCRNAFSIDSGSNFGFDFDLCATDPDCWHSTAAALLATGTKIRSEEFSIQALSRVPFWNVTKELSSPRVEFFKDSANEIKAKFMTCSTEASDCGDIESEDIRHAFPDYPSIYLTAD